MDTNQPVSQTTTTYTTAPPPRGLFGSKVPSSAAFVVAILLFLMPFVDIKCNGTSLKTFSGLELATGFDPNIKETGGGLLDDIQEKTADVTSKATDKTERNFFLLAALIAGGLGLLMNFVNSKALIGVAMVAALAGAGTMIAGMLDIKKEAKKNMKIPEVGDKFGENEVSETVDKIGGKVNNMTDNINITVDFTPWFYISVIAFLAAAYFCYRRMSSAR